MSLGTKILIGVLLVVIPVSAHVTDPITGEPFRYVVSMVDVAPSVDGVLDDPAWEMAEAVPIAWDLTAQQTWKASEDFAGVFRAVWRDHTLYVAIQIRDDQIDTAQADIDQKDRLVLYIDREHLGRKDEQYQFVFPVQEDRTYEYYPQAFVMWGPVDDVCEISFDLEQNPQSQLVIGFGIEYYDVDAHEAIRQLGWPPESEVAATDSALGDFVFETKLHKDPQQISVTWGAIKALF